MEHTVAIYQDRCTGCSVCANICPVDAITMKLNTQGYLEPCIDEAKCISCEKCQKCCPLDDKREHKVLSSYYGWHKEESVRYQSSSGGAVRALADEVLKQGGVIFGAVYTEDYRRVVFGDSDTYPMEAIQKSKYTVSDPEDVYVRIKGELEKGRKVMFTGAPCQAAGLKTFLGKENENLLVVDFICGGMASLAFWQEHVAALEKKHGAKLSGVDFRSKKNGWGKCLLDLEFANGKTCAKREYLDTYYKCFMAHISVRETCLSCPYADRHYADISVADFWGYRKAGITDTSKGLSLLIANTALGEEAVLKAKNLERFSLDNQYSAYAVGKVVPAPGQVEERETFFKLAQEVGFEAAAKKLYPATYTSHTLKWLRQKFKF